MIHRIKQTPASIDTEVGKCPGYSLLGRIFSAH